jgi:cell wall-associated NlpC family hydrolase
MTRTRSHARRNATILTCGALAVLVGSSTIAYGGTRLAQERPYEISIASTGPVASAPNLSAYVFRRAQDPARTEVLTPAGKLVAVLTDGARTAHLQGPRRTFAEPRFTKATVTTTEYVRLAPQAWRAGAEREPWFGSWLAEALADRSPDVLAVAMEYAYGAPPKSDKKKRQFSGDASFGPLSDIDPDGRAENSDFYDYLGVGWEFPDGVTEKPSATHLRSLDCSGFLRMVYGYRLGFPLRGSNTAGPGLPRRAFAMAKFGPGALLMPNTGRRARELDRLLPGDLLFFNAGPVQGSNIEHSGMYLGVDDRGHHRFVSSRSQANGPTMGDLAGESILDGTGYWALRFRTARRI